MTAITESVTVAVPFAQVPNLTRRYLAGFPSNEHEGVHFTLRAWIGGIVAEHEILMKVAAEPDRPALEVVDIRWQSQDGGPYPEFTGTLSPGPSTPGRARSSLPAATRRRAEPPAPRSTRSSVTTSRARAPATCWNASSRPSKHSTPRRRPAVAAEREGEFAARDRLRNRRRRMGTPRRARRLLRLFDHLGWTERIFNHISMRVPGPDHHFLINPFGLHYSEVRPRIW